MVEGDCLDDWYASVIVVAERTLGRRDATSICDNDQSTGENIATTLYFSITPWLTETLAHAGKARFICMYHFRAALPRYFQIM